MIALVENNPQALQSNSAAVLRRFSDGNVPLAGQRTTRLAKPRPTIEELREYLDYKPETGVLRWKKSPGRSVRAGAIINGTNNKGYTQFQFRRAGLQGHRVAFALHHGRWPEPCCDHINCVKTDNRATNLRECTHASNMQNRPVKRNTKTGVKGVRSYPGRYQAYVRVNGVTHTKSFRCLKDADDFAKKLREQLHGEFARHE